MLQMSFGVQADWYKTEATTTKHRLVRMKTEELFTQYRFKATIGRLPKRQMP